MKTCRLTPPVLFTTTMLAVVAFGAESSAPAVNATFVDSDSREAAEIRGVGEAAINRLAFTLVNELNTALAKGTLEAAVDVAHLKNLPKTGDRVTGLPRIKAIKLTSPRLRSAANTPDAADQLAIDRVIASLTSDAGPAKVLVQRIESPGAPAEWRVYRPVGTMNVCLRCHGAPGDQPAELRAKLAAAFPKDQATGYQPGEFRGLVRVTVDNPPPTATVPASAPAKPAPKKK